MATAEPQVPKLSDIFDRAWKIQLDLEGSDEASNSDKYQLKVKEAIGLFEQCTEMVNQLSLFSDNEDVEEIPTSSLKYLLLPAFLGDLSLKVTGGAVTRLKQVHKAKIYFQDFLKRCKSYGITAEELPKDTAKADPAIPAGRPNLMAMQSNREAKIKRFKEKKQLEEKLKALGHPSEINSKDEDVQREFFTLFIKKSASEVVDDYASVQQEIEILGHMEKLKDQDKTKDQKDGPPRLIQNNPSRKPLKPFILTRDDIQAKVFGAGYPSIPTMTLDEYYEKEVREGKILPPSNQPALSEREAVEQREIQREKEIEDDDETALKKAREMDDWKDDNKRGSGNRQNMG